MISDQIAYKLKHLIEFLSSPNLSEVKYYFLDLYSSIQDFLWIFFWICMVKSWVGGKFEGFATFLQTPITEVVAISYAAPPLLMQLRHSA